jgi:hypothetical protein
MNNELQTMMTACEGRYPTRAEQAMLRDWAARLDGRLAAVAELQAREEAIVGPSVDEVLRTYPDLEKRVKDARRCCLRDESLVLRYCALALLRGDPQWLEDALLTWMATILRGVGFAPDFIAHTYQILARSAARELSPGVMEQLRPYLDLVVTVLSGKREAAAANEAVA